MIFGHVVEFVGSHRADVLGFVNYDVCDCVSMAGCDDEDCAVSAAVYRLHCVWADGAPFSSEGRYLFLDKIDSQGLEPSRHST